MHTDATIRYQFVIATIRVAQGAVLVICEAIAKALFSQFVHATPHSYVGINWTKQNMRLLVGSSIKFMFGN